MKKTQFKRLLACILAVIMIVSSITIGAYERKEHDKYTNDVLFRNFKNTENDEDAQRKFEVLASAAYLCIDQFNGNGQSDLDILRKYNVKELPKSITDSKSEYYFDFSASGTTHRSYTHRGWDFNYFENKAHWEIRKKILLNTAEVLFDFKGNEKQKDSFCALIYYVHVIADYMDDDSYLVKNGLKMSVGGRSDNYDIISELIKHIGIVFKDQKHTHKYNSLISSLKKYNNKFSSIVRSDGGVNNDKEFGEYKKLTKNVMKQLTRYIPEMLKEEEFFHNTFYK